MKNLCEVLGSPNRCARYTRTEAPDPMVCSVVQWKVWQSVWTSYMVLQGFCKPALRWSGARCSCRDHDCSFFYRKTKVGRRLGTYHPGIENGLLNTNNGNVSEAGPESIIPGVVGWSLLTWAKWFEYMLYQQIEEHSNNNWSQGREIFRCILFIL